jgi:menaquinone-dependent protoporphyrinogen oxidase
VRQTLSAFMEATGWQPGELHAVAGALRYRESGRFIRWLTRFIAKRGGLSTDTSRDHEYTNWAALERDALAFVGHAGGGAP